MKNKRTYSCGWCKEFQRIYPNDKSIGICAKRVNGNINRQSCSKACLEFNPITVGLPPAPKGEIKWIPVGPNNEPIFGSNIIVRHKRIRKKDNMIVSILYDTQETRYDGTIKTPISFLGRDDEWYYYVPTHYAYINNPET